MKTFIKQINEECKDYAYFNIVKTMHIEDIWNNTKAAIVAVRKTREDKRHYTIFYKYSTMKKISCSGRFESQYDNKGNCIYNAYIDACEEFTKYAN